MEKENAVTENVTAFLSDSRKLRSYTIKRSVETLIAQWTMV
jgi:hypothetical protein